MALLVKNFRPVGFASSPDMIAIDDDGHVATESSSGARLIDCKGAYLSPGWCDAHVHVWYGGTDISVRAQQVGRATGVTSMIDAGSAGEANFHGLREYVIDQAHERIKAFLNIGSIGLVACNRVSELIDMRFIDIDRTIETVEANRDVICGIKVRASAVIVGGWGITPARIAKRVAQLCELPLMVHVGEAPPLIDEVFDILSPGDVVTHCFNGKKSGSIRGTNALFEQAKRLSDNGILMDIGHGAASFDFTVARDSVADGFIPFSISTDVHQHNIDGPVFDLATTMGKLLAVGMSFDEVIEAVTNRPRGFLGFTTPLATGERADFTVFDLEDSELSVEDSMGVSLTLNKMFEPKATIMGCDVREAQRRGT